MAEMVERKVKVDKQVDSIAAKFDCSVSYVNPPVHVYLIPSSDDHQVYTLLSLINEIID